MEKRVKKKKNRVRNYRRITLCHDLADELKKGAEVRKSFQKGLRCQLPDIVNSKEIKLRRTGSVS